MYGVYIHATLRAHGGVQAEWSGMDGWDIINFMRSPPKLHSALGRTHDRNTTRNLGVAQLGIGTQGVPQVSHLPPVPGVQNDKKDIVQHICTEYMYSMYITYVESSADRSQSGRHIAFVVSPNPHHARGGESCL